MSFIIKGDFDVNKCNCKQNHKILRSIHINEIKLKNEIISGSDLALLLRENKIINSYVIIFHNKIKYNLRLLKCWVKNKKINITVVEEKDLPKRMKDMEILFHWEINVIKNRTSLQTNVQSGYSAESFPNKIIELNSWGRLQTTPMVGR